MASANHVRLNQATYNVTEVDAPGVRQIVITATLNGNYVEAVKFINALEREKTFSSSTTFLSATNWAATCV